MWIGNLSAHNRHHIGITAGDHVVGVLRCANMALGGHQRIFKHRLEGGGQWYAEFFRMHEGWHHFVVIDIITRTTGHIVELAGLVVQCDNGLEIFE